MTANKRPIVKAPYRRKTMSPPAPVPCPRCYAVMRQVDGVYVCVKHGPKCPVTHSTPTSP